MGLHPLRRGGAIEETETGGQAGRQGEAGEQMPPYLQPSHRAAQRVVGFAHVGVGHAHRQPLRGRVPAASQAGGQAGRQIKWQQQQQCRPSCVSAQGMAANEAAAERGARCCSPAKQEESLAPLRLKGLIDHSRRCRSVADVHDAVRVALGSRPPLQPAQMDGRMVGERTSVVLLNTPLRRLLHSHQLPPGRLPTRRRFQ